MNRENEFTVPDPAKWNRMVLHDDLLCGGEPRPVASLECYMTKGAILLHSLKSRTVGILLLRGSEARHR